MARLRVTPELIAELLFGENNDVTINGASFDSLSRVVLLDIYGPEVPDAEEVTCIITKQNLVYRFEQVK